MAREDGRPRLSRLMEDEEGDIPPDVPSIVGASSRQVPDIVRKVGEVFGLDVTMTVFTRKRGRFRNADSLARSVIHFLDREQPRPTYYTPPPRPTYYTPPYQETIPGYEDTVLAADGEAVATRTVGQHSSEPVVEVGGFPVDSEMLRRYPVTPCIQVTDEEAPHGRVALDRLHAARVFSDTHGHIVEPAGMRHHRAILELSEQMLMESLANAEMANERNQVEIDLLNAQLLQVQQQLEDERLCKICRTNTSNTVYLDCGHVACRTCADMLLVGSRRCHICRANIKRINPVFPRC